MIHIASYYAISPDCFQMKIQLDPENICSKCFFNIYHQIIRFQWVIHVI